MDSSAYYFQTFLSRKRDEENSTLVYVERLVVFDFFIAALLIEMNIFSILSIIFSYEVKILNNHLEKA